MKQRIEANRGQITQTGDIINCQGGTACPFRNAPESQLQADFARAVGIWCPREARQLLEALMHDHGFTARELAAAWRAGSVLWRVESSRLVVRAPLVEAAFGWGMVSLMLAYYLAVAVPALLAGDRHWQSGLAFLAAGALYLGSAWLAGRFILWPRRIALRVRRVLQQA